MAYSELVKNFERIRDYMREFYVYGFKSRTDYTIKSARSYDNERRRIESWLGDFMGFRQSSSGKNVFLSIDSRNVPHNPLYQAFKAKSFTDGDITLHFIIFDILYTTEVTLGVLEIARQIDEQYLSALEHPMVFDESTIRKKLKEYVELGLLECEKQGRTVLYRRAADTDISQWQTALQFYSEADTLGIVGNYLLDRGRDEEDMFSFKHHYITHALESEVLCSLFDAMRQKRSVTITNYSRRAARAKDWEVVPLRIFVSVQSGRRYLLAGNLRFKKITSYRLDYITSVQPGEVYQFYDEMSARLVEMQTHMWGVACSDTQQLLEHVAFTVGIPHGEEYIWNRLEREKRCGTVTKVDDNTARFEADIYDTSELIPWMRTFLCRITSVDFSNKAAESLFKRDLTDMYRMYGIGGANNDLP